MSLEREVDQMINDMMQKEGWARSYVLSILRSKFESEERHQEVSYVDDLIQKEAEEQEKEEQELAPTGTATIAEVEEVTTSEPQITMTTSAKGPLETTRHPTQQQKQETVSSKSISRQLDKQTIQINKKITQILQPIQKQSQLIKQLQSQLKQLQKQVSQIQRIASIGKKKNKKR